MNKTPLLRRSAGKSTGNRDEIKRRRPSPYDRAKVRWRTLRDMADAECQTFGDPFIRVPHAVD